MAPIACGQYYWVYMLAAPKYKKASSYIIGWLTSLAWIATVATESLFAGTIIQGLMIINNPSYDSKLWQGTLLTWVVILFNVCINVFTPNLLPKFEIAIMILHLAGFVAIMVALLTTSDIGTAKSVWLTAFNEGGWSTQGLSYCVGFLGNVATFVGADASVHMAEEVSNASLTIPRAICAGMIINGIIGFAMMITTLYCLGDVESVLEGKTGFPFIQIFFNSTGSAGGAVGMGVVVLVLTWMCAMGITTTASRMTWAFARDKGMPFSKFLSKVNEKTRVPVAAIGFVTIAAALLTCIYIGSSVAFNDVISLTITGFYGSYFLPCALLLYHRLKGNILPYGSQVENPDQAVAFSDKKPAADDTEKEDDVGRDELPPSADPIEARLVWGPWRLPGIFGTINNIYACTYMIFVIFWSVWPPATPVTASTMNYSIVVTGGIMILSGIWYFIRGRKEYRGPVVDDDVAVVARRAGSVVAM
jgi:choline transport protein